MKLTAKTILVFAPLFMALCACGGGQDVGSSSSDAPAPSKTVNIDFWHTFGQKVQDGLEVKAEEFKKIIQERDGVEVNIKADYQGGYPDVLSKIEKGLAIGNTPTMAIAYPDHVANYLAVSNGSLVYNLVRKQLNFLLRTWHVRIRNRNIISVSCILSIAYQVIVLNADCITNHTKLCRQVHS